MQYLGVLLGLVATCALLPGHNGVKSSSTLSASSAVKMMAMATAMPVVQKPAVRHGLPAPQHKGELRGRRRDGSVGVPVTLPLGAASLPLVGQRTVGGEHLVQPPNILQGIRPNGEVRKYPLLNQREELELIHQARFYVAAADAKRELRAAATDHAEELFEDNHEELLRHIRTSERQDATAAKRSRSGVGATAEDCGVSELPESMTDTEFRLREALGRGAYNKLFLHNQGLIYNEVHKLFPNWRTVAVMEKADLLQEGAQGMLRAIRLFDTGRAVRFSTYATWHVRSYILRAVRDKLHVVRLPQNLQRDMSDIRKARYRYTVENQGHSPSPHDLADMLEWPTQRIEKALDGLAHESAVSLDESTGAPASDGQQALHHRVPSAQHGSAASENALYQQQLRATLGQAMSKRDPRRVQLLRLRYGLEDGQEWSFPQLGSRFNMTARVAKGMVHQELNFLRRQRTEVLQQFVES